MLKRPDFNGERKLDEEDGEWVLVFQVDRSGLVKRDRWMRIGTERNDWRGWCTKRTEASNRIGKKECQVVVAGDIGVWSWVLLLLLQAYWSPNLI
jgi:hypothetical protein